MAQAKQVRGVVLILFVGMLLFLTFSQYVAAQITLPAPKGFVNDFAGMLDADAERILERKLASYEAETTTEIAVVTVDNLQDTSIEDFAVRLFEQWQIGKKEKDNGILMLVAKSEKKMRIEVGYGLEPTLTDGEAYGIIVHTMRPKFQQDDFSGGVEAGIDRLIEGLEGQELPEASPGEAEPDGGDWGITPLVVVIWVSVFGSWIVSVLARSTSWWAGGVIGAAAGIVFIVIFGLIIGMVTLVILTPLGLLFDYIVSKNFRARKKLNKKPSWWAGGWWGPGTRRGGFGRSSGGFGGFGGGSSGGGGASGGW